MEMAMITGMHAVVYTCDVEADRTFFRDVLGFSSVDGMHAYNHGHLHRCDPLCALF